ncbi:MAG TPA: response regulator transcription factor [Gammaproteobacteria bacterium]
MKQILVVEDDRDIAQLLVMHLADLGCKVTVAIDGNQGYTQLLNHPYDLVILDIMMPGMDGFELCKKIRNRNNYTPVLMLTARSSELDRVLGLELGADDYLAKPFSIRELLARVKAIFRRVESLGKPENSAKAEPPKHWGDMVIDAQKHQLTVNGKEVELTAREFDLLWHFAQHPGQVFTRTQLLDSVWGYGHDGYEHTVNSHINRLRAKIEKDPSRPDYILTVWGVGYKFNDKL